MTTRRIFPDLSLFSRYVDHELSPEEEHELSAYLLDHPEARDQVARIERAMQHITRALIDTSFLKPFPPQKHSPDCLSPEEITAYLSHSVFGQEKERMDTHFRRCDTCLREAVEARKIASILDPTRLGSVPAHVTSQAEALWRPSLSRIVLQLVQHGLQHVTHMLTAPILYFEVEPLGVVTRGSTMDLTQSALTFRLNAANASVQATAVAARDGITLMMTWTGNQQEVLTGKHIQIRQDGMAIFMMKTDAQGKIQAPYLSPGVYDMTCPELQVAFQLELLFESEHTEKS